MDGLKAYRYFMALKLHFTTTTFDVFVNRGHVKITPSKFATRNDRFLFEKLAKVFPNDKDFIQYVASNYMYGNPNMIYDHQEGQINYTEYIKRKQSMTHVFASDLATIVNSGSNYTFSGTNIPDMLQLLLAKRITVETVIILDAFDGIINKMKESPQVALLFSTDLLRLEKSRKFVTYDSYKVAAPYQQFIEDIKGNTNG